MTVGEENVYRFSCMSEILLGQPYSFYTRKVEEKMVPAVNLDSMYMMITGLDRGIYRPAFGIASHSYMKHFVEAEKQIRNILNEKGVVCMTTMLLYDHTKRFCMIFSPTEQTLPMEVAQIATSRFNVLYDEIFNMNSIPYANYAVLSDKFVGYDKITSVFQEIDALSRQQYFDMRTMVMTPMLLEQLRVPVDPEQIHEELMQMYVAMRAGEIPEMLERYHEVMRRLEKARDFDLLTDAFSSMRATLEGVLCSHGVEPDASCREVFTIANYPTIQLQRDAIEKHLTDSLARLGDSRPMSQLIQEAVRYIRHHYAENISVADIAEHIGMSQSWLTKRFKQECGCNILNCLLNVRVERAKALLVETDMLILEIACACGFDNPGYFISVFRRVVGSTPKAYREEHKK